MSAHYNKLTLPNLRCHFILMSLGLSLDQLRGLAVLVAVTLVNQNKFDLGVGVLLAHHCMLRVDELVRITVEDIEFGSQFSGGGGAGERVEDWITSACLGSLGGSGGGVGGCAGS